MKQFFYNLMSWAVKVISKGDIVSKAISGSQRRLYYERSQHLVFLFQRKIRYEEVIQGKIKEYIDQGDLVFDIGGNIGQYAIPLSERVGSTGRVVSFEPDFKNFAFLQFNVNINRCINVMCVNCGIGGENTELKFYRDTETGGRRGSFKREYTGTTFQGFSDKVNLKKFDTIISEFGKPDFVKIDVEGFESDVLSGLTVDLSDCMFLVEVREETKRSVFNYFSARSYACTCIDKGNIDISTPEEIPGFANLIFRKVDSALHRNRG